ncbi:hypothetical protein ACQUQU_04675 [Thalassolituus sp. LLYu03]|uniref:hypothetical protein n=1 Tax=Thalassolituus sp. LLYu03 TaxID=3421656 RepID=UPI003D2C835C
MQYPQFIAIDGSSWEEHAHPVAIAWSMADGQIKTTLIQPDDDWDDWDIALQDLHGITPDTLYQRGETLWSVIRELEGDLEQPYLYADDTERVTFMLEKIYEACNRDLSIEIGDAREIVQRGVPVSDDSLHMPCDDRVYRMLKRWASEHGRSDD